MTKATVDTLWATSASTIADAEDRNTELDSPMKCPFCQADNDRVIDSRASQDGFAIRRRRECLDCKRRYTTYERVEGSSIKVIKKDGAREPFDRAKIKRGLEKACWKRPVSDAQLEGGRRRRGERVGGAFRTRSRPAATSARW